MDESGRDLRGLLQNPSDGVGRPIMKKEEMKAKVVVIMGPTGSGKSKLAIDLASHFPVEVINADSMQVYRGLDVLTNKVPLHERQGVPHHLLGTVSPNVEFTAKEFRDSAIPLINEILSRSCLPVIVGGTNYYIQALVSPFLLDDVAEDLGESFLNLSSGDEQTNTAPDVGSGSFDYSYDFLQALDPVAANRVHPNNHRKINQFLNLYARSGILPSKLYQEKAVEYVEQRVDCMIDAGLLSEVYEIYSLNADYTRGLRQAIGVREFDNFLRVYLSEGGNGKSIPSIDGPLFMVSTTEDKKTWKDNMREVLQSSDDNKLKMLLAQAIDKVKANTRRLVRQQKRRLTRLQTLFGWNMQYVDATESISSKSEVSWSAQVVGPAVEIIRSFLNEDGNSVPNLETQHGARTQLVERNLWTQYVCKACGDKLLRGAHEWEQHKQGRGHRKRISRLRKSQGQGFPLIEHEQKQHPDFS